MSIDVAVVVVSSGDDNLARISERSVRLGGQEVKTCAKDEALKAVSDAQYAHVVLAGTIVHPCFYEAMLNACEHENADYTYCPCACLGGDDPDIVRLNGDRLVLGQILVRSWVLRELGVSKKINKVYKRVVKEYCGVEVPHALCTELPNE